MLPLHHRHHYHPARAVTMMVSTTYSSTRAATAPTQLILRGTREGDLAATLSAQRTPSSSRCAKAGRLPLFTWSDLVAIVSTGNLQRLARHPEDLREYFAWMDSVKLSYGSVQSFILAERLTASYLLDPPPAESDTAACFKGSFEPSRECQILVNDWPYSVPTDVIHNVVWSYRPILHRSLVAGTEKAVEEAAWAVVAKRGLCGSLSKHGLVVPSLQDHAQHVPDLHGLVGTCGEQEAEAKVHGALRNACREIVAFVEKHWDLDMCEVVFFANPPSLQSVPSLAHFHVLVRPL
ncbi:hypothetical protein PaG_02703 [Moesziomyces aphidis]|uniref:Uncharacterized protein n=1 Tax=Moesziomyces aphidis TaxID=84754 RepID=W3VMZ0_MOEAP|nr:hypothetical protein PaG_02703 [Moesziomyces aphidis]